MTGVDVEVRGGGIFGLAIAWACAGRGASVRVVEKRTVGGGASGGPVGALAPHSPDNWNPKKAFQLESLLMSQDWWANAAETGGIDPGYARTGRIQPVPDRAGAEGLARKRGRDAASNWKGAADWSVAATDDAWHPHSASGLVVRDTLSARINPVGAVRCLAEALRRSGCDVLEGASEGGTSQFTVWATGHEGLLRLNREFSAEIGRGEKGQALLLDHDAAEMPQIFCDGIHVVPHANGTTAVGSTSERHYTDPGTVDAGLDRLHARAVRLVPAIRDSSVITGWAGIRPRSTTRAPLLGRHPLRTGQFIANGGFKTGFGFAPLVGETMADLMLDNLCRIPAEFLTDNRLGPHAAGD